jgi:hypothetical protein
MAQPEFSFSVNDLDDGEGMQDFPACPGILKCTFVKYLLQRITGLARPLLRDMQFLSLPLRVPGPGQRSGSCERSTGSYRTPGRLTPAPGLKFERK